VLDALRTVHSFDLAVKDVLDHTSLHRLLAVALGTSLVFAVYFVFAEVSNRIGSQAFHDLFFKTPSEVDDAAYNDRAGEQSSRNS
jgi:hypothetical protein